MTEKTPLACSLDAGGLRTRLAAVAEVGRSSLISRERDQHRHLLRFRLDAGTRAQLEQIIRAEQECCEFISLTLEEQGDELVLSIEAPAGAQAIADDLAAAFANVAD